MRRTGTVVAAALLVALALCAGCAKRQLTSAETGRLDAIAAKIAQAEEMGARECAPRELARAKATLEHARHELEERNPKAEDYMKEAEAAADDLLAKTKACVDAKKKPEGAEAPKSPGAGEAPAEKAGAAAAAPGKEAPGAEAPQAVAAEEPPPPKAEGPAGAKAVEGSFENIQFDFDKSDIREDARPILKVIADYLKQRPEVKIRVEGHCDERGTSEYNMALGDRRATAAMKYLQALGVPGKRMATVSFGKERPLDPAHTEEAWAKNRRAVFAIRP